MEEMMDFPHVGCLKGGYPFKRGILYAEAVASESIGVDKAMVDTW
jgi:hypothetical protein